MQFKQFDAARCANVICGALRILQSAKWALSLNLTASHRTNKIQTAVVEVGSCPKNNIQSVVC